MSSLLKLFIVEKPFNETIRRPKLLPSKFIDISISFKVGKLLFTHSWKNSYRRIAIFEFIQGFGQVFTWALMFIGMMITHQYTVLKAIATTLLTILGMAIIGFVIVLVMYLIQQLVGFVSSLTTEISFRMNE